MHAPIFALFEFLNDVAYHCFTRLPLFHTPRQYLENVQSSATKFIPPHTTEEHIMDVSPVGGTLVLFDSVSVPHEVPRPLPLPLSLVPIPAPCSLPFRLPLPMHVTPPPL